MFNFLKKKRSFYIPVSSVDPINEVFDYHLYCMFDSVNGVYEVPFFVSGEVELKLLRDNFPSNLIFYVGSFCSRTGVMVYPSTAVKVKESL